MIDYKIENSLNVDEFRTLLINSTLGERRPIDNHERLVRMLKHANLIVTARDEGRLIGISRSLSDFSFCTYLSDMAVDKDYQKMGIGRELIKLTMQAAPDARLILLSAPASVSYYPRIGMTRFEHCYYLDNIDDLR
jgi:predicted N-acetyltransferase YhbS